MTTSIAYRASLVREIERTMKRIYDHPAGPDGSEFQAGQNDAYAHVLQLIKDDDL